MKIEEILFNLPIGKVVPPAVLAILKRKKLIYDYAPGGYLMSQHVYYMTTYGKYPEKTYDIVESGGRISDGEKGSSVNPFSSRDEMAEAGYTSYIRIEYKGHVFETKYLSGCFKPFLIKSAGPTAEGEEVTRSMHMGIFGGGVI